MPSGNLERPRELSSGLRACAFAALWIGSLAAQTPAWNLPASGYVYDSVAGSIRPVVGFLGSSYAGQPVFAGASWASIGPGGHAALLVQQARLWWVQDLSSANLAPVALDSVDPAAVDCRWSADGSAAAILSAGASTLTWLSGSQVTGRRDLSAIQNGSWTLLAADAKANWALLTAKSADAWTLWLLSPDNDPANLGTAQHPIAAAFAQHSAVIYLAEADVPRISRIFVTDGTAAQILGTADGLQSVSGLALSTDDRSLFAADPLAKAVHAYNLISPDSSTSLPVTENPGALLPIGAGQFLVNSRERPDAPLLLLDTSTAPKVWFVPMGAGQ